MKEHTARLSARQRAFVEAYIGNATEAAIKAGYSSKTAKEQGHRLLANVHIQIAIQEREKGRIGDHIAGREERQRFWTGIMRNEELDIKDRLKASEVLGKSEGDFLERVEHTDSASVVIYRIPDNGRGDTK